VRRSKLLGADQEEDPCPHWRPGRWSAPAIPLAPIRGVGCASRAEGPCRSRSLSLTFGPSRRGGHRRFGCQPSSGSRPQDMAHAYAFAPTPSGCRLEHARVRKHLACGSNPDEIGYRVTEWLTATSCAKPSGCGGNGPAERESAKHLACGRYLRRRPRLSAKAGWVLLQFKPATETTKPVPSNAA
jgi:hypothetical protein